MKKWGRGPGPQVGRPIEFEKPDSYRDYGVGLFWGEAANSRPCMPVQLFFHSHHSKGGNEWHYGRGNTVCEPHNSVIAHVLPEQIRTFEQQSFMFALTI